MGVSGDRSGNWDDSEIRLLTHLTAEEHRIVSHQEHLGQPGLRLHEYFVDAARIHREVLQSKICKYLGPESLFQATQLQWMTIHFHITKDLVLTLFSRVSRATL